MMFTEDSDPSLEECERVVHALKGLLASDGWKVYRDTIEKQQTTRFNQILLIPLPNLDAALEQEYTKGEVAGMRTAIMLPETLLQSTQDLLQQLQADRQNAEGAEK